MIPITAINNGNNNISNNRHPSSYDKYTIPCTQRDKDLRGESIIKRKSKHKSKKEDI